MNNLRILRSRKGVTQQEVADYLGVNRVSYLGFENGKTNIKPEYLIKLAKYFDTTVDDILGEKIEDVPARPIVEKPELEFEDETLIPVIATLRCGFNYIGEPYTILRKVSVPKSYKRRWGNNIVGIEAAGNSMMPTIKPKDLLIVIPGSAFENGNIVVVDINDSDTVKRIRKNKDGSIDLIPDNEEFETMHLTPNDLAMFQVHVLGRVAKVIGPDLL